MTRIAVTILLLLMASAIAWAQETRPSTRPRAASQPITDVADLHRLTQGQAARQRPVKLHGIVTYLSTGPQLMFVQAEDGSGAFCVAGPRGRDAGVPLKLGTHVEVEGVTAAGRAGAYVTGVGKEPAKVQVVSEAISVLDPLIMPLDQAARSNGELVEVEAVVRSVLTMPTPAGPGAAAAPPETLVLKLADGRDIAEAALIGKKNDGIISTDLVGATVRVRGVFNGVAPDRQHVSAGKLLLRAARDMRVVSAARPGFELTPASVSAIRRESPDPAATTRARVRGVVTVSLLGKGMYVQADDSSDAGLWVSPAASSLRDARIAKPGDRVDIVGFPSRAGWTPALDDAVWRTDDRAGALPTARLMTPDRLLNGDMDGSLVRLESLVLSVSRMTEGPTLVLQSADRVFLARLPTAAAGAVLSDVREGSWVRVTGVCVNDQAPHEAAAAELTPVEGKPVSFHLLLPSATAIEVIAAPGPWTLRRVLIACAALATASLAALAWVVALRRRVAQQTGLIRAHLANETLYEERARIARDLHDSLQQDLLGITMQLTATEKLLDRPEKASQSLKLAAAMVRRSQAETHRTVWDLRERQHGQHDLVATLRDAVAALDPGVTGGGGARAEVRVTGEPRELPQEVENHVLRVALEAVTNAVKHAGASKIEVTIKFAPTRLELRVTDDGKGFDADRPPPPGAGHFGLFGMRERAEKVGGEVTVRSKAGEGTVVTLAVPIGMNGTPRAE